MTALERQGAAAKAAARVLATAGTVEKNEALEAIARTLTERSRAACPDDTQAGVLRALLESRDAPETWPADDLPDSLPDGLQNLPWWMLVISALAVLSVGLVLFWDAPSA